MIRRAANMILSLTALFCGPGQAFVQAQEFRALWVDAFHAGFRSASEVSQLVADARAGRFNAVIVEVRKRGDAYYNSRYEPKASDVTPSSFDPLADLCAKAHNTNGGQPRIEVHAWIVTYPIWNNSDTNTAPANHPLRRHPDWLSQTASGTQFIGNYVLDPGHPEVQRHTFNVAMDIITNYPVDGLNFDYIRYFDSTWGYNDVAVARFNARFGRSGAPATSDPLWKQFRRDQVTALVRKVYLSAIAVKPQIKISADTVAGYPGVTTDADFVARSQAYKDRLQDWRAWMEEGILDMNILMAYFNQAGPYAPDWTNWNAYIKDRRYNRHSIVGPGLYLNTMSNAVVQLRYTRQPSPAGNRADGLCGYSYATPTSDGTPRATFLAALTDTNVSHLYETNLVPLFPAPTNPPVMPWKAAPTLGHLMGVVTAAPTGQELDGALVTLTGPVARAQTNDATGFYGFVDLPPGSYTVTASFSDRLARSAPVQITAGMVTTVNLALEPPAAVAITDLTAHPGRVAALVTWHTSVPADSQVEYGLSTNFGSISLRHPDPTTNHLVFLGGLTPNTNYFFRALSRAGTNLLTSATGSFSTAGEIVLDNPSASFAGSWSTGTSSGDKFGADYRYATSVSGEATATATFTPQIETPGLYDVYLWYPQGGNRSTNAPVLVAFDGGSVAVSVNQETGGGNWRLVAAGKPFARGTSGFVRISNNGGDPAGNVVMADAVRFVYATNQDPPLVGQVPEWWSLVFFGMPVNGLLDHDGDGYSTAAEYALGTWPTHASSKLEFRLLTRPDALDLDFAPFLPGRLYRLRASDNVNDGGSVLTDLPPTPGPEGHARFTLTNLASPRNFYQLQVELPR